MFAGPPKNAAVIVASPSPNNVLFNPGSSIKFSPTTWPLVVISPICSINVASTTGAIIIIAPKSNLGNVKFGIAMKPASAIA
ncbi:Uncharacterised protein [Clostridioides difficile]|nr:Uncharacterised protein [Clostridioides difficile]